MITLDALKQYAEKSNLKTQVQKLKPEHWKYAESILSQMRDETETEMNRVWSQLPRNAKPPLDDKLARIVPELIVRVISSKKTKQN